DPARGGRQDREHAKLAELCVARRQWQITRGCAGQRVGADAGRAAMLEYPLRDRKIGRAQGGRLRASAWMTNLALPVREQNYGLRLETLADVTHGNARDVF